MPNYTILYDEPQESAWFRALHSDFANAKEEAITAARNWPSLQNVLAYDKPDIILLDDDKPILVVEETVEVPSGHNVGQRFARIAAAAESGVPCLYFGPYVAKKHGGKTAGPRYMNARLFYAIDAMVRTTNTAITTISWPVDRFCEVRRDHEKDKDVREYINTFIEYYKTNGLVNINVHMLNSEIQNRMSKERDAFILSSIRRAHQYNAPPPSVTIYSAENFVKQFGNAVEGVINGSSEIVVYNVGMTYIRSDPYTGMAMLYKYLYISEHPSRSLILWFPNIGMAKWRETARRPGRKDIRLYKIAANGIMFSDGILSQTSL